MLKTILDFKGVQVLSSNEQKRTIGGTFTVCLIPWTDLPYTGPCDMLPPDYGPVPDPFPEPSPEPRVK